MNYPKGIKLEDSKYIQYANRGMDLENDLNLTNEYYINKSIAFIYKKPTPIQVSKLEYKERKVIIKEAFFKNPSTTDYNGLYDGKYIDFEAKETNSTTSFPLNNIHKHQIEHISNIVNNKGICFIIVRFSKLNKTFLLFGIDFIEFIRQNKRKSIPINYFNEKAYELPIGYSPRLDYLKIVKEVQI